MSTVATGLDTAEFDRELATAPSYRASTAVPVSGSHATPGTAEVPVRGTVFWICRYLPAEIAGTAALVLAGLGVTLWTDSRVVIALTAYFGSVIGFYAVLAVTIYAEQAGVGERRATGRSIRLLREGSGIAELVDTLLVRPVALLLGVWLVADVMWGLLAGKLVADIVFYSMRSRAH